MSQYGILLNGFWDGDTGRQIARAGGCAAQLVAVYLMQNPDANMIGLYPVRLAVIQNRIETLSAKAIRKAVGTLSDVGFADYDLATEHVWVREMAKFRLGLHRQALKKDDNRVKGAQALYRNARPNPFLSQFFKRYRKDLHLSEPRRFEGTAEPLKSPSEGPSKPVTGSVTEAETYRSRSKPTGEAPADARMGKTA